MSKSRPLRRLVEQYYARLNNISVEAAQKILAHDKKLYNQYKKVVSCQN